MNGVVVLHIDTSDTSRTVIRITRAGVELYSGTEAARRSSQTVLPGIERALKSAGLRLTDIGEIIVHTGPGSFTGLRVGVTVARTLGQILGVPVNGGPASGSIPLAYEGDRWGD